MKFLRLNQALSTHSSLKSTCSRLKSRRLQQYLWLGLMLGMSHAQADSTLTYQPTLGDYQRFEQGPAPDRAQGHSPHTAHDHAAHESAEPDAAAPEHHQHDQSHDMKMHDNKLHDHGHEQE